MRKRESSESPAHSLGNSLCTGLVTYCIVIMSRRFIKTPRGLEAGGEYEVYIRSQSRNLSRRA